MFPSGIAALIVDSVEVADVMRHLSSKNNMFWGHITVYVAECMQHANYSLNFLLYLFTGRTFRRELKLLIKKCCTPTASSNS